MRPIKKSKRPSGGKLREKWCSNAFNFLWKTVMEEFVMITYYYTNRNLIYTVYTKILWNTCWEIFFKDIKIAKPAKCWNFGIPKRTRQNYTEIHRNKYQNLSSIVNNVALMTWWKVLLLYTTQPMNITLQVRNNSVWIRKWTKYYKM